MSSTGIISGMSRDEIDARLRLRGDFSPELAAALNSLRISVACYNPGPKSFGDIQIKVHEGRSILKYFAETVSTKPPMDNQEFQASLDSLIQEGEALAAVGKVLKGLNRRSALKVLIITAIRYDLFDAAREALGVLERLPKEEPPEVSDTADYSKCCYCPKPATRLLTSPMIVGSKGVPFCEDDHDVQQTPQYKALVDPKWVGV